MVYWSITMFFPVERDVNIQCETHTQQHPFQGRGVGALLRKKEQGKGNKAEGSSWKLGKKTAQVVLCFWSLSKNNSGLPRMCPTNCLPFFSSTNSSILIFISIVCLAPAFYLQCIFQGNAIVMKCCLPCFHRAHSQKRFLIIKSTLSL